MTEATKRRHGLEPFLAAATHGDADQAAVNIEIRSGLFHLNLRGNPGMSTFMKSLESVPGLQLPTSPNTFTDDEHRVYWLGPDEWLILTERQTLAEELEVSLKGVPTAINDMSGGSIALQVTGAVVPELLAKGCTLDLHPGVFMPGMCAQSGLAKANVLMALLAQNERQSVFEIVVRRSFSDYLIRWIKHAAREFGSTYSTA